MNFEKFEIVEKHLLHNTATMIKIKAPLIVKNARAGQFVIIRAVEGGERIPLTIVDCDKENGLLMLIFQIVGATTKILNSLNVGDSICDVLGPLGKPSNLDGFKRVCVVGGGVGCANIYPVAKYLKDKGVDVYVVLGFRTKNLVILKDEFKDNFKNFVLCTDDGSFGEKGIVTDILNKLLEDKINFDMIFVAGPLVMMKYVCKLTQKFNIKTVVSMNPIMIDGTGMCGSCRVMVGGKLKFACVDGPDFDGHLIDFDDTINKMKIYNDFERTAYKKDCNLFVDNQHT